MDTETPHSEEIRALVETRLAEARKGDTARETVRVEWRSQPRNLDVVTMPVGELYYNPRTHRIRAQRAHNPERDTELERDPWSPASQDYLHTLLKAKPDNPDLPDPDFLKLQDDLRAYGQKDAGIITHTGILVNGNSRRAAMRELSIPDMRVAVLPADANWSDIASVELELQLRKDHRRDYSYINRLIAINERHQDGRIIPEMVKEFRTTRDAVERDLWVYGFIVEAVARSRVKLSDGSQASLRLMDFEGHQETLRELYRAVRSASSPQDAEHIKENRLVAILVNTAKTKVRFIGEGFHGKYLTPHLDEQLGQDVPTPAPGGDVVPGLGLSLEQEDSQAHSARATTDRVLRAAAKQTASPKIPREEAERVERTIEAVRSAVEEGVTEEEKKHRRRERKLAAPKRLAEAAALVQESTAEVASARSQGVLADDALDSALIELSAALKKLSRHASRGVEQPGKGLAWLQDAAAAAPEE